MAQAPKLVDRIQKKFTEKELQDVGNITLGNSNNSSSDEALCLCLNLIVQN